MAGFWVDAAPAGVLPPDANLDTFFAPQSFDPDRQKHQQTAIKTHDEDGTSFLLNLTLDQKDPIQVSMLMDPRGKIHATCGLLPVKSIQIPPDQYKTALQNMEVAFLSAPLLTLPGRIHVSLPREPGFGWSWVQKKARAGKSSTPLAPSECPMWLASSLHKQALSGLNSVKKDGYWIFLEIRPGWPQ